MLSDERLVTLSLQGYSECIDAKRLQSAEVSTSLNDWAAIDAEIPDEKSSNHSTRFTLISRKHKDMLMLRSFRVMLETSFTGRRHEYKKKELEIPYFQISDTRT